MKPVLPLWAAALAAALAGPLLDLAYPSVGFWPAAFGAVVLVLLSLIGRSAWGAVLVGAVFALTFHLIHIVWITRYLGPIPWFALTGLETVLMAAMSVPITLAYRWLPVLSPGRWARLIGLPALVAGLWMVREIFVGSWPYTGFPWARLGMSQSESPLATVASWVSVNGLGFLMVFACAAAIEAVRLARRPAPRRWTAALPAVTTALILLLVPAFPTTDGGSMRVGSVQGNGPSGYFDQRAPNAIIQAQLDATAPLVGEDMDVLLWPEGLDSDPINNPDTAAVFDRLSTRLDAPLIVNGATARGDDVFNTSVLWTAQDGAVALHDKRNPVPMGEYVPDRWFYEAIVPDLIGLIGREYTPGSNAPFFDVDGVGVGLAICFDVIYDDVIWEGANDGAEVYMFQTNNADFRDTDENLQQLAFARMRAVETGRSVVNISTVGTSQVIGPDGTTIDELPAAQPGAMLTDVPLRTGLTPSVILGPSIRIALFWGPLAALVLCGVLVRVRDRADTKKGAIPEGDDARSA